MNQNLEETKVREIKESIKNSITSHGGVISYSKDPEKTRLSYPINHQRGSYFGFIHFNLSNKEALSITNEQLKLNPEVLRYLVVKTPSDLQKKQSMIKQIKMRERAERRSVGSPKPTTPSENKELDKKLEDILENI